MSNDKSDFSHVPGPHYCTRCGEPLNPDKMVWLELNWETGKYAAVGMVPEDQSQGRFPFGAACARRVMKSGGECRYTSKSRTFR